MSIRQLNDPEGFAKIVRQWIEERQYSELFQNGCCFHFALRAFEAGIGDLHAIELPAAKDGIEHVFVMTPDDEMFDNYGYQSLSNRYRNRKPFPITKHEVEKWISSRCLPSSLEKVVFEIADQIIAKNRKQI
jgi:hypothetical protein